MWEGSAVFNVAIVVLLFNTFIRGLSGVIAIGKSPWFYTSDEDIRIALCLKKAAPVVEEEALVTVTVGSSSKFELLTLFYFGDLTTYSICTYFQMRVSDDAKKISFDNI